MATNNGVAKVNRVIHLLAVVTFVIFIVTRVVVVVRQSRFLVELSTPICQIAERNCRGGGADI